MTEVASGISCLAFMVSRFGFYGFRFPARVHVVSGVWVLMLLLSTGFRVEGSGVP